MASSPGRGKKTLRVKQPEELLAQPVKPAVEAAAAVHVAEIDTPVRTTLPRVTSSSWSASNPGCMMWIHLQASICTEWEHTSMVLSQDKIPGSMSLASLLQVLHTVTSA